MRGVAKFMSMTVEELKEKARLTDDEINDIVHNNTDKKAKTYAIGNIIYGIAKAQQDKDFKAFIKFCKENNIKQAISNGGRRSRLVPVSEVLR